MADVTGIIGNEVVELNNAATEATLRQLLAAIQSLSGTSTAANTARVAATAGINNANTQLQNLANQTSTANTAGQKLGSTFRILNDYSNNLKESYNKLDGAITPFVSKLMAGSAGVSDFYNALKPLPGVLGVLADLFGKVSAFQEQNLNSYQQLTNAGVNFGGSLTQLRQAALDSYMSLDQFTNLMKNNGEQFAKFGGSVNEGGKAFLKISKQLLDNEAGDNLRALGYTTEEVNQGLINYLANTGARSRKEMQNTDELAASAAAYMSELDALAQITGKSRQEQEKALKQANANAAFESYKMTLGEKERKALELTLAQFSAKFGKAGEDMVIARTLGIPYMTEASRKLAALAPGVDQAVKSSVEAAKSGADLAEIQKYSAQATQGAVEAHQRLSNVLGPLSMSQSALGDAAMNITKEANKAIAQGRETATKELAERDKLAAARKQIQESEARDAIEAQKALQQLGQTVMAGLLPAIKFLTELANDLVIAMGKYKEIVIGVTAALGALVLFLKGKELFDAFKGQRAAGRGVAGAIGSVLGGGATALGSSPLTPMYVMVVGRTPGGGGRGGGAGGRGGGGGTPPSGGSSPSRVPTPSGGTPPSGGSGLGGKFSSLLKLAAPLAALESVFSGGMGLLEGKKVESAGDIVPEGWDKLNPFAWAMRGGMGIGELINKGYGSISERAGGSGNLGGDLYNLFNKTPKFAAGGIVMQPTLGLIGEASKPEAVIPLDKLDQVLGSLMKNENYSNTEYLKTELETLNKQTAEVIRYLRDTAEHTKQTVDATKSLNGDLFRF